MSAFDFPQQIVEQSEVLLPVLAQHVVQTLLNDGVFVLPQQLLHNQVHQQRPGHDNINERIKDSHMEITCDGINGDEVCLNYYTK